MIRNIVSSKDETDCIYLQCDSGSKILKVYHYPRTTTCEEIFLLDYIGTVCDPQLLTYKYIDIKKHISEIIVALRECFNNHYFTTEFTDVDRVLKITRDESKITRIELYHTYENKKKIQQRELVWNVSVRLTELNEFTDLVNNLNEKVKKLSLNTDTENVINDTI